MDSSEQYAINVIGDKTLQSANYVVKESKRALDKAIGGKPIQVNPISNRNARNSTPQQAPSVEYAPSDHEVHTPAGVFKRQEGNCEPAPSEPYDRYHTERQNHYANLPDEIPGEPEPIHGEPAPLLSEEKSAVDETPSPATSRSRRASAPQKESLHQGDTSPRQMERNYSPSKSGNSPHMPATSNSLSLSEEPPLSTWERSTIIWSTMTGRCGRCWSVWWWSPRKESR